MLNFILNKQTQRINSFLLLLVLFGGYQLTAQQEQGYTMGPVHVSGTKMDLDKRAGNVWVITHEEIQSMPVFSLDQILRYAGGVEMQNRSSVGAQADFSIRGSTFTQVVILVDGIRIYDPLTGHSNSFIPVDRHEIYKIEVYRGGASYKYGPDAMGGVINFITLQHADTDRPKVAATPSVGVGNQGTAQVGLGAEFNPERHTPGVYLGSTYFTTRGFEHPDSMSRYFLDYFSASMSVAYSLSDRLMLRSRVGHFSNAYSARNFYTFLEFDQATADQSTTLLSASLHRNNARGNRGLDFSYQHTQSSFLFNEATPANIHTTSFFFLQGFESYQLSQNHKLFSGFQADQKTIQSTDRGNHQRMHAGAFASVHSRLGSPQWYMETAMRYDYDQQGGQFVSPNLGLYYMFSRGNTGLRVSRSHRAPDFTELYINYNFPGLLIAGRNLGNPNLSVERATTVEWSVATSAKGLQLNAALFGRFAGNLIDYVLTPYDEVVYYGKAELELGSAYNQAQNLNQVHYYGAEASMSHSVQIKSVKWSWDLHYVGVHSSLQEGVFSRYLFSHARHLLQANMRLTHRRFETGLASMYKNRRPFVSLPVYDLYPNTHIWVSNAYFSLPMLQNGKLNTLIEVENLFNSQIVDVMGAVLPGRLLMLKLSYNL